MVLLRGLVVLIAALGLCRARPGPENGPRNAGILNNGTGTPLEQRMN